MGFFSRNKKETLVTTSDLSKASVKQQFGVPLVKIGKGDVTKPYIDGNHVGNDTYVRFGHDNLYPSLIDQMYYQSTLHGSLIDFQVNAAIGGGWRIDNSTPKNVDGKVKELAFTQMLKLKKNIRVIAKDIKMHGRCHFLITKKNGVVINAKRIMPAKVRLNNDGSLAWVSNNWLTSTGVIYPEYSFNCPDGLSVYSYSNVDESPGQDVYALPKEISAFNWCYLDGQSSNLQKKNIEKSIFGTIVIRRPKAFQTDEELQAFKAEVSNKEGDVVPVLLFAADGMENVADVEAFPANQNDKAFEGMYNRIDAKICQAHSINPVLILEGTGGLGSGSDITAVYPIWEKNVILPYRSMLEEVIDDLMMIFGIEGYFKINNFQIIDGEITDEKGSSTSKKVDQEDDTIVNDNLKGLSAKENADIYRIIRDFNKGRLNESVALARLLGYGFDKKTASDILK